MYFRSPSALFKIILRFYSKQSFIKVSTMAFYYQIECEPSKKKKLKTQLAIKKKVQK